MISNFLNWTWDNRNFSCFLKLPYTFFTLRKAGPICNSCSKTISFNDSLPIRTICNLHSSVEQGAWCIRRLTWLLATRMQVCNLLVTWSDREEQNLASSTPFIGSIEGLPEHVLVYLQKALSLTNKLSRDLRHLLPPSHSGKVLRRYIIDLLLE